MLAVRQKKDVILVKGSCGSRMSVVVNALGGRGFSDGYLKTTKRPVSHYDEQNALLMRVHGDDT